MSMYIKINFHDIEGYSNLSNQAKELFETTYRTHNSGLEYKQQWIPIEVSEYKGYLKVTFNNGQWLHFYNNGEWG